MHTREKILLKAHELFNRFGFRRVTMDEIALKTGMSKKTIYQVFATKDEIVEAVVDELITKSVDSCETNSAAAENAIHEIFLNIDTYQEMMSEMNPVIFEDLEKFFPVAFAKLSSHINGYLYEKVKHNLNWGIEAGLYREELNVDVIAKYRIKTMFIPFNQEIYPYGKFQLAQVEIEILEHFLYGISTIEGQKLIRKYKQEKLKVNSK